MDRAGVELGPRGPVSRIECFDISHSSGKETTASCVVWQDGRMNKRQYRSFNIREVEGVDDFSAIAEAVGRRYRRLRDEERPLPDLVLIDGGVGQLNAAMAALDSLGLDLPIAAIAKRAFQKTGDEKYARELREHLRRSVAIYEKLVALTDTTDGNDPETSRRSTLSLLLPQLNEMTGAILAHGVMCWVAYLAAQLRKRQP